MTGLECRAARRGRGWTIKQLALLAGVNEWVVQNFEAGRKQTRPDKQKCIEAAFRKPYCGSETCPEVKIITAGPPPEIVEVYGR